MRLGVGRIISESLQLSLRNYFGIFFLYLPVLILYVALFGEMYWAIASGNNEVLRTMIADNPSRFVAIELAIAIIGFFNYCAVMRLLRDRYVGASIPGTASALAGIKRVPPFLGLVLVALLAYMLFALATILVVVLFSFVAHALAVVAGVVAAGYGLYLAFPYVLAGVACVVEETGPIRSYNRSKALTDGYRWPLLGLFALAVAVLFVLQLAAGALFGLIGSMGGGRTVVLILSALWFPVISGWMAALTMVAHYRLTMLKDGGPSSAQVANVFE